MQDQYHLQDQHKLPHGEVGSVAILFFRLLLKNTERCPQAAVSTNFSSPDGESDVKCLSLSRVYQEHFYSLRLSSTWIGVDLVEAVTLPQHIHHQDHNCSGTTGRRNKPPLKPPQKGGQGFPGAEAEPKRKNNIKAFLLQVYSLDA